MANRYRISNRRLYVALPFALLTFFSGTVTLPRLLGQNRQTPAPATSARASAPIDLTGYWVSVVTEDWRYRMVTPLKGDYMFIPLNAEGRRVADAWNPDADEAAGNQCKAYGAPSIMRMPTRLHITWQDDNTLKIETDTGEQVRLLHFGASQPPAERSWQGYSVASWERPKSFEHRIIGANVTVVEPDAKVEVEPVTGSLKVVTTHLRAGYIRTNGVPYSENAVLTEYFDLQSDFGTEWLIHFRILDDPKYLTEPHLVNSQFKREPDGSKWHPEPCMVARPPKVAGSK